MNMISYSSVCRKNIFIRWTAPPTSTIKLNIDGSCDKNNRMAVTGVLLDESGNWLKVFSAVLVWALFKFGHCIWDSVLQVIQFTQI